jgi:hypothetical protein
VLFNKDLTTLWQYPAGNTRSAYEIPSTVQSIGAYAFADVTSLTSVTIPSSVTNIGAYAFEGSANLRSVRFLGNAPYVNYRAFNEISASARIYRSTDATGFGLMTDTFAGLSQAPLDQAPLDQAPIVSDPSNQGTPTAPTSPTPLDAAPLPPATPTSIIWFQRLRSINQPITSSFTAAANTTYTITATSNTPRNFETRTTRTARGTCNITTNKKTKKRTAKCTIRLNKAGTWLVAITPVQNGVTGTPATKTIKVRATTKKTRTLPVHQRQTLAQR